MTRVFLTELYLIRYEILTLNHGCISNQKDIEISTTCYVLELINGMDIYIYYSSLCAFCEFSFLEK